jgi:hypothetical protein
VRHHFHMETFVLNFPESNDNCFSIKSLKPT